MNKVQFIKMISKQYNCTTTEAKNIVDIFTSAVKNSLKNGNQVKLTDFGTFCLIKIKKRNCINPNTKERIVKRATVVPKLCFYESVKKSVEEALNV